MNIFYLSKDPKTAAVYHNDKHVVKMILESAQLLSTAHRILDGNNAPEQVYKATHKNHPSAIWARTNINNYMWLYSLFCSLCDEYKFRYNKTHLTDTKLRDVLSQAPMNISKDAFFQPPQAMPDTYRSSDSVTSYRNYYRLAKNHLAKWSKRNIPDWYQEGV